MLNFALLALILLAMIIPVAIIWALGLAVKGVSSLDLSILDFYIVIATTHALAVLVIAEIAVVAVAAYLRGYTQISWLAN